MYILKCRVGPFEGDGEVKYSQKRAHCYTMTFTTRSSSCTVMYIMSAGVTIFNQSWLNPGSKVNAMLQGTKEWPGCNSLKTENTLGHDIKILQRNNNCFAKLVHVM